MKTLKATGRFDSVDRKLLDKAQEEFPLTDRPWQSMGMDLGLTEREVMDRLNRLSKEGIIRKIGPALDARRVGLGASTLIAMKVPEDRVQNVAKMISKHREVSHCYQREHEYNLWFTIAARDERELEKTLEGIRRGADVGEDDVLNLPSVRTFKIDVRFQLT